MYTSDIRVMIRFSFELWLDFILGRYLYFLKICCHKKLGQHSLRELELPCFGLLLGHVYYLALEILPRFSQHVNEHLCEFIDFSQ